MAFLLDVLIGAALGAGFIALARGRLAAPGSANPAPAV
jgi:hypothetical protein